MSAGESGIEAAVFSKGDGVVNFSNVFKTTLIDFIKSATSTIDVAIYNLRDDDVIAALKTAYQSGKTVRIFTDSENNKSGDPIKSLPAAIVRDDAGTDPTYTKEMHHKFVIVDGERVWTGSANFTAPSFSGQNNNAVIIRSADVAAAFQAEFNRLYVDGQAHTNTSQSVTTVTLDDSSVVTVRFAPGMNIQDALATLITEAGTSFYYAIYTYNSSTIADAMIGKKSYGNFGLFERSQADVAAYTKYDELAAAGLKVELDDNALEMHHKFLVVDAKYVATGSYNFTSAADEDNDENSVIIQNTCLAKIYTREINRIAGQDLGGLGVNDYTDTTLGDCSSNTGSGGSQSTTAEPGGRILAGPNPFTPGSGVITFTSQNAGAMSKIEIYDLNGRLARRLQPSGSFTATWDGRNSNNAYIASGMYYYRIESGGRVFSGRITVVR